MKIDIRDDHYKIICDILRKHLNFKDRVYAFGSRVKWTTKDSSDLDLAIDTDKDLHAIRDDFEDSDLPYFVDVLDYREIPDSMREEIDSHKLPLAFDVVKLGDVVEIKYGKDHKSLNTGSYPCFGSGGCMRWVDNFLYDDESILIPRKGTLNNIMYQDTPFWTVDTMFWSKLNKEIVFPKYLYYQLKLVDFSSLNVGSAVPSLTVPIIENIDVILPPLEEQERIADILSAFDDKIELNRQICHDLEHTAKLLFRKNFIEHEDREKWESARLGDYTKVIGGFAFKGSDFIDTGNPVIKIKNISSNQTLNLSDISYVSEQNAYNDIFELSDKDIVIAMTGATIGKFAMIYNFTNKKVWLNQRVAKISKHTRYWNFIYTSLYFGFVDYALNRGQGSAQANMSTTDIEEFSVPNPPQELLEEFEGTVAPLYDHIKNLQNEIIHLTQTRDLLLPKLMRGE